VPGASASVNAPFESVCVVRPPGDAVTVASVTGRGGQGCPACSTGHVGPAPTVPSTPFPVVCEAAGAGVTGTGVETGAFVANGDGVGYVAGDGVGDEDPDDRCFAVE
jgi:hypothetical protein